jgi:4-aminobutyrate--pyruvate transaminase
VAINAEMTEAIERHSGEIGLFGHGFTYGGHPLGCAVGVKALEIYEKRNILAHVQSIQDGFQARIQRFAEHPLVGEARGIGLLGALELTPGGRTMFDQPGKVGARLAGELVSRGVILRAIGDTLAFCPPMVITDEELDALFAPIETALDATYAWAKAEGMIH